MRGGGRSCFFCRYLGFCAVCVAFLRCSPGCHPGAAGRSRIRPHSLLVSFACRVRFGTMRYFRLQAFCVILSAVVQSATCFLVTGNCRLMTSAFRYRERAANTASASRGGSDTIRMGSAGKKKKKVRSVLMHPWLVILHLQMCRFSTQRSSSTYLYF